MTKRRRLLDDPERRERLAQWLQAIGCTCTTVEIVDVEVEGVFLADIHHDPGCACLRRTKAWDSDP